MAMVKDMMQTWEDTYTVRRVFGDPVSKGDVVVIPVAKIAGGGGGGAAPEADAETAEASGGGFGGMAKPAGVYVVRADSVEWQPALDVTMIAIGGIVLGAFITAVLGLVFGRRR